MLPLPSRRAAWITTDETGMDALAPGAPWRRAPGVVARCGGGRRNAGHAGGVLRGVVPPAAAAAADTPATQVQFGAECAEGLAEGKHVATNCAINWTDKDGK